MSDEKLDLILNVVSDIKVKVDKLETRFDGLETRFDGLETRFDDLETRFDGLDTRFDGLETKFDGLENQFKDFKKQVIESFAAVHSRFETLEKQMVAIGVEIKAEIKAEVEMIGKNLDRLEEETLHNRTDTLDNRRKIREVETRLTRLENHVGITV